MRIKQRQQPVLIGGEAEEPAFLHRPFHGRAVRRQFHGRAIRGFGRDQFRLVIIGFVADRVPAFVAAKIEITSGRHTLPQRLHQRLVVIIGGADEPVETDVQRLVQSAEGRHHLVNIGFWRLAGGTGSLIDLEAMFVGAGEETHGKAIEALEAGDHIAADRFIGMAHVRTAVGIGDGGGEIETGFRHDAAQCGKAPALSSGAAI